MTKRKQIDELTAQVSEASRKAERLEAEKEQLSQRLIKLQAYTEELEGESKKSMSDSDGCFAAVSREVGSILGAALEEAESIKNKAREDAHTLISTAELHAASILGEADNKTILRLSAADARADEILRSAEEKASAIILAAKKSADDALPKASMAVLPPRAEAVEETVPLSIAAPPEHADEASPARLPAPPAAASCEGDGTAMEQLRSRVVASMEVIKKQNELLASDVNRQTKAVLSALSIASNRVLLEGIGPEDCEEVFSRSLAEALLATVEGEESEATGKVGEITFSSVSELQSLGGYGLRNNVIIKRAVLPEGLETLPESFFFGCVNLREVVFPKSLEAIGDYSFYGCARLARAKLPRELERIGDYAFSGCESLKSMELPLGLKSLGTAVFRNCGAIQSILVDSDCLMRYIGSHAMQSCASLREFRIPEGVRLIPTSLFYGCGSLREITIPASVERIDAEAFKNCVALDRVVFMSPDTKLVSGALTGLENVQLIFDGERLSYIASEEPVSVGELRAPGETVGTELEEGQELSEQTL